MPATVLLCRVDGNFGGVERHLLSVAKHLDPNLFRPIVVTLAYPGELERQARQAGIPTEFIPMRNRLDIPRASRRLVEIAQCHEAKILHTFGIRSNTLAVYARRFLTIPWVIRLPNMNTTDYRNPLRGLISHGFNNYLIRQADALQVISSPLENYVKSWSHPPKRVYPIPNGVDLAEYSQSDSGISVRQQYQISVDDFIIGSVGRLDFIKGYDWLLQAYHEIRKSYPRIRLMLVGDGPERKRLVQQAERLNLQSSVIFVGYVQDVKPYLAALDLFVCSSRSEGVPNSLLEAMAMGLPIVSTRVGGVESVIRDGVEGLLVPSENVASLVMAVSSLLRDRDKAQSLAHAARLRMENEFSLARMIERVQTMYQELMP